MARNFWEPGARKKAFYAERARHDRAEDTEVSRVVAMRLISAFKKKANSRLKTFYSESQKMDKKVQEMLNKAESMGFYIDKFNLNPVDEEYINNFRKRTKEVTFNVHAHRDQFKFLGKLRITPASMLLSLNSPQLQRIYTKSNYALDHLRINYYRTMNISDNYLAAVIGGGKIAVTDDEALETLF